jgi:hypothetical protein
VCLLEGGEIEVVGSRYAKGCKGVHGANNSLGSRQPGG